MTTIIEPSSIVRVRRVGEGPPRCHYCGNESWDLVSEVIGRDRWRVHRLRHPETLRGSCPSRRDGWLACYRCDRAAPTDELQSVSLRMDVELGRLREERPVRVDHTVERRAALGIGPGQHSHPVRGEAVEDCPTCVPPIGVTSEWANYVIDLEDGSEVAYTDYFPAVETVRCAPPHGCSRVLSDENARGEPSAEDLTEEARREEDARWDRLHASEFADDEGDPRLAMLPLDGDGLDIAQLASLWGLGDRSTRERVRGYVAEGLVRATPSDHGKKRYVRVAPVAIGDDLDGAD